MAKMKVELEGVVHPDKGSIERALCGVNRQFDGTEKAMEAVVLVVVSVVVTLLLSVTR